MHFFLQMNTDYVKFILVIQSFQCVCLLNKHEAASLFSVCTSFVAYSCLGTFIKNAICWRRQSTKPCNDYIITSAVLIITLFVPFDLGRNIPPFSLIMKVVFLSAFPVFLKYSSSSTTITPSGGFNDVADRGMWLVCVWTTATALVHHKHLPGTPIHTVMNGAISKDY